MELREQMLWVSAILLVLVICIPYYSQYIVVDKPIIIEILIFSANCFLASALLLWCVDSYWKWVNN